MSLATLLAKFTDGDGSISGMSKEDLTKALMSFQSSKTTKTKRTKRTKSAKTTRDPNKPKRGSSAYMFWLGQNRADIKTTLEEETGETPKVTEVTKKAGELWKALDDEAKQPFQRLAEEDKERYGREMAEYQPQEEYPTAPDGWSGPYQMKYLYKNVKGSDGKAMKFKSFEEAIEAARSTEDCGGITKTSAGYTLRIGPDLITTPTTKSNQGLASWIKGELSTPIPMVTTDGATDGAEDSTDGAEDSTDGAEDSTDGAEEKKVVKRKVNFKLPKGKNN